MVQVIGKRYQILEELGKGGMGTVYRGLDTQSKQTVAIKQLKPELTTPELIERFVREGTALRDLNHPNIVKMLNEVEENGNHYLIIEYLAGGDLSDMLKKGQLAIEKVLQLAIDICDALTRAHRLDIIHRDLKPANVLLADDGTPRLTDFGIAHIGKKERVTDTDAIVGTVDYLAPEVLDGDSADPRADIWAFGVMLFEILAGERPFKGDSVAQTLMAIMTQPVPDLEALRSDVPIALVDLIYRMLEKSRDARIRSVRQVGLELEDMLHGRTAQTPPKTRFSPETPDFLHRPKHNLPAQTTPFVGRESELVELAKLLDDPKIRLITVLAPGGMGKSRLALRAAEQQIPNFENGVFFVELAPLSDPSNIISAIADATSYQFQSDGRDQKQQILDFLRNKNLLLVLDNFEHLLEGTSLVTDILKATPNVQTLATSRQRLSQPGETLFHLSGMDFPEWETPADAMNYAAVKLFMNSASRAQPSFELTTDNLDYVARICRLVQGMPLGIVLAAAWLAMLSPQEIADEIVQGIDFLADEGGEVPERQHSIGAVFDYSWQQMTEAEQQVFMKLTVFRGGFTREAAQVIAGASLRLLMSLINKSLIRRDARSGRYEIHELLRQYAEAKLETTSILEIIYNDHARYYADFLHQNMATEYPELGNSTINQIALDFHNIESAWQYIVNSPQDFTISDQFAEALARFCQFAPWLYMTLTEIFLSAINKAQNPTLLAHLHETLGHIYRYDGQLKEALANFQKASECIPDAQPTWKARVLQYMSYCISLTGKIRYLEQGRNLLLAAVDNDSKQWWYERINNLITQISTYYGLADVQQMRRVTAELQPILQKYGTPLQVINAKKIGFSVSLRENRYVVTEDMIREVEETADILAKMGTPLNLVDTHIRAGVMWLFHHQPDKAEPYLDTTLKWCEVFGEKNRRLTAMTYLTTVYRMQYQPEKVMESGKRSLELATELKNEWYIGTAEANLAWRHWYDGSTEQAWGLAQRAITRWTENYPFQWIGLLPLIALAVQKKEYKEAMIYTRKLLHPIQQKMPDELEHALASADQSWESQDNDNALKNLMLAIERAKTHQLL